MHELFYGYLYPNLTYRPTILVYSIGKVHMVVWRQYCHVHRRKKGRLWHIYSAKGRDEYGTISSIRMYDSHVINFTIVNNRGEYRQGIISKKNLMHH